MEFCEKLETLGLPPPPCGHVLPGGELYQPCKLAQLVVSQGKSSSVSGSHFGKDAICRQSWGEVASNLFDLPSHCFGFLGGGEIRFGADGNQFAEKRHLSPISYESGLQPVVCCQPARSGEGLFLAMSPGFIGGCIAKCRGDRLLIF